MNAVPRATRRRIERLAPAVQRLYDADVRYFERHPDHVFRLRLAGAAEVQTQELMQPDRDMRSPGLRVHVFVRRAAGVRLRLYVMGRDGIDTDRPQAELRALWERCSPPGSEIAGLTVFYGDSK